jgi:hypothetical protein
MKLVHGEEKRTSDGGRAILAEFWDKPDEPAIGFEDGPAHHPENAGHPSTHAFAETSRLLCARYEVAHERLLAEVETRHESSHLEIGLRAGATERRFDVECLPPERNAQHRKHGLGILAPARRR